MGIGRDKYHMETIKCPKIDPCGYNKSVCDKGGILNLQIDGIFKQ